MRVGQAVVVVSMICVLWILTISAAYQIGNASVDPVAPFDFSLSNSDGITVTPGGSGSNTIIVTLLSGTAQGVTLFADVGTTGIAFAVVVSFNPRTVTPTCRSTCTITASSSTLTGSYPITVIGTGGGLTRTTSFTLTVSTLGEKGSTWIVLDASPKPGYANNHVTISGTMYGSWRSIWQGKVVGKPVEIATCWGFRTVVTTDYGNPGQFSVTTNCPSQGGTYTITATFYKDEELTGTSTTIQYEVISKTPTTITISYIGNREFGGYLRRVDTGAYLGYKPVKLTIHFFLQGMWWTATYELQTRGDGYWSLEFYFYWNSATIVFEGDETYAPCSNTITQ